MWICPKCQEDLIEQVSYWTCSHNHRFDTAKEGYVNLLLANQKRTKEPGDSKEMINARRAFLEQGHYLPLAEKLVSLIRTRASKQPQLTLYDIGCGEGYYLAHCHQALRKQGLTISAMGSDISKNAIQKAAKKYKACQFAVASNANLPSAANAVDVLLQVFAPANVEEIQRVLSDSSVWLQVMPDSQHLKEIKNLIYSEAEEHKVDAKSPEGFVLCHQESLTYTIHLEALEDRRNLLMMTPFYWAANKEKIGQIIEQLDIITVAFSIKLLSKTDPET
jgi:23S rRNA (guanine745-N1)-methyltransferase